MLALCCLFAASGRVWQGDHFLQLDGEAPNFRNALRNITVFEVTNPEMGSTAGAPDGSTTWMLGFSKGDAFGSTDLGKEKFDALFHNSTGVIKRVCTSCIDSHKEIYYKRIKDDVGTFNVYDLLLTSWTDTDNKLNTDFELYSTEETLKSRTYKWQKCNYNDPTEGFPRDCGPIGLIKAQSATAAGGQADVAFYIEKQIKSEPIKVPQVYCDRVDLAWSPVLQEEGPVLEYVIFQKTDKSDVDGAARESKWNKGISFLGVDTVGTVKDLMPNSKYSFKVMAKAAGGAYGNPSKVLSIETKCTLELFKKSGNRLTLKTNHTREGKELFVHPWDVSRMYQIDQWENNPEEDNVLQLFDATTSYEDPPMTEIGLMGAKRRFLTGDDSQESDKILSQTEESLYVHAKWASARFRVKDAGNGLVAFQGVKNMWLRATQDNGIADEMKGKYVMTMSKTYDRWSMFEPTETETAWAAPATPTRRTQSSQVRSSVEKVQTNSTNSTIEKIQSNGTKSAVDQVQTNSTRASL